MTENTEATQNIFPKNSAPCLYFCLPTAVTPLVQRFVDKAVLSGRELGQQAVDADIVCTQSTFDFFL